MYKLLTISVLNAQATDLVRQWKEKRQFVCAIIVEPIQSEGGSYADPH